MRFHTRAEGLGGRATAEIRAVIRLTSPCAVFADSGRMPKFALALAAIIFAVVAILQLIRALSGWPVMIGETNIPILISWIAAIVAGALAWLGYRASRS